MSYTLGIDLGTSSIGWALLEYKGKKPVRIVDLGSRIFPAGMEGEVEQGREESRNKERREARQRRRQLRRRNERKVKAAEILAGAGLLPQAKWKNSRERDAVLKEVDKITQEKYDANGDAEFIVGTEALPYYLRARALHFPLDPHEVGRVFYHLAQRRGFQSNRKTAKKDEEEGIVKAEISGLETAMASTGSATLGEYLANTDPHGERRIRSRYTHRSMYDREFNQIWEAQQRHHPDLLTDSLRKKLHHAIFFQRPLKKQKHLVGFCELEHGRRKAPWSLLDAQRFRYLQRVNDLLVIHADGTSRQLTPDEREALIEVFETSEDVKFTDMRKRLKLKGTEFNLEQGGEKKIPGNRTAARLRKVFGNRWDELSQEEQQQVVEDVRSIVKEETLARRAKDHWGLDDEAAEQLAGTHLEDGYCAHSRQALTKLLPLMEDGVSYATAKDQAYPNHDALRNVCEFLPPVFETEVTLKNPTVLRSLTELRKVVNAIIRKHGKPDMIRIELARDLKQPRDRRKKQWSKNRARQKEREKAAQAITKQTGNPKPSRADIEKYMLAEECNWICPYTGKQISMASLFGDSPRFDIEHIAPFSRSLDNSFLNKTLCDNEENRTRKGNKLPREAYSDEEMHQIIERVKRFKSDVATVKLQRFQMDEIDTLEEFTARALGDTRYASTQAAKYLGWLYGPHWRKHIQSSTGQVTGFLRNAWRLNGILNDGGMKTREDHRHHAVDAVAIALASPYMIKTLSSAAEQCLLEKGRDRGWWKFMQEPWNGFFEEVRDAVEDIVVSHRVNHKLSGPMHEETNYGLLSKDGKGKSLVRIRRPLKALSKTELNQIGDREVARLVKEKMDELGESDPGKAFADPKNHPFITSKGGKRTPIHCVRVHKKASVVRVGKEDHRARYVAAGNNHHAEFYETTDKKGNIVWKENVVSLYEAMQRYMRGEPVIKRDFGPGTKFLFSLAKDDMVELDDEQGGRMLCVVRVISEHDYNFAPIIDARRKDDMKKTGDWVRIQSMKRMQSLNLVKKTIGPLGEVYPAND